MSAFRVLAGILLFGFCCCIGAGQEELNKGDFEARRKKIAQAAPLHLDGAVAAVSDLLVKEDFDELERLGDRLRKERTRSKNGNWQLEYYYDNLCRWWTGFKPSREQWLHAKLDKWREAKPDSVKPLVAKSEAYMWFAWEARGEGYSYTVTEEGWREFDARMDKAVELLDEAVATDPCNPEIYTMLVSIGKARSMDRAEMEAIFEKGLKAERFYIPLYYQMALASMPRWGGSVGDLEKFMERAVELTRESEGESMYARIVDLTSMYFTPTEFKEQFNVPYERLKQSYWDLVKRYPQDMYYLNSFCYWAYTEDDLETAIKLRDMFGDNIIGRAWRELRNYELFTKRIAERNRSERTKNARGAKDKLEESGKAMH